MGLHPARIIAACAALASPKTFEVIGIPLKTVVGGGARHRDRVLEYGTIDPVSGTCYGLRW